MSDKTNIIVQVTPTFKDAIGTYATQNNLSSSEVMRRGVAALIAYDLKDEIHRVGKPTKYNSIKERNEARATQAREDRATAKLILEYFKHESREVDIEALEAWIERQAAKKALANEA